MAYNDTDYSKARYIVSGVKAQKILLFMFEHSLTRKYLTMAEKATIREEKVKLEKALNYRKGLHHRNQNITAMQRLAKERAKNSHYDEDKGFRLS